MCPSAAGTTAKRAGWMGAQALAATAVNRIATRKRIRKLLLRRLVDLDHELRAAHAHDGGRRADLHRFGRLLDHLAGDRGKAALAQVAFELARVRRGVELVLVH